MSAFADQLDELRRKFLARADQDRRELAAWSRRGGPGDDEVHRRIHRLAGAAGTFGFASLSNEAKRLDDRLADGVKVAGHDADALIGELDRVLGSA